MERYPSINVLGEPLAPCSFATLTGFYRNGCCDTGEEDMGQHTVCVIVDEEFLEFSKSRGNDLITPQQQYRFPGLRPGDRWCLCASRWWEAFQARKAPKVVLQATHQATLDVIPFKVLNQFAVDPVS
ncbi:MAG: DUF2237 domain-containing protein [Bacteroidota bacterium]